MNLSNVYQYPIFQKALFQWKLLSIPVVYSYTVYWQKEIPNKDSMNVLPKSSQLNILKIATILKDF